MGPCWTSFDFASALDMLAAARALLAYGEQEYATGIRALPRVREKGVDGGWWAGVNRVCFASDWRKKIAFAACSSLLQQPTAGFTCEPGCRSGKVQSYSQLLPEASANRRLDISSSSKPRESPCLVGDLSAAAGVRV